MSLFFSAQNQHLVTATAARILVSEGVHADAETAMAAVGGQFKDSFQDIITEAYRRAAAAGGTGMSTIAPGEQAQGIIDDVVREALVEAGSIPSSPAP